MIARFASLPILLCSLTYFLPYHSSAFRVVQSSFNVERYSAIPFPFVRRTNSVTVIESLPSTSLRSQPVTQLSSTSLHMTSSGSATANTPKIQVVSQPDQEFLEKKGVFDWDTWSCGVSKFPWTYGDSESCYLLAGLVKVTPSNDPEGAVTFRKGDFVTFPAGMSCTWDVQEAVKKHYTFF